jgi:UDP-N-acetylmuramyl pentapeptide phosphotransferase/UDP-N-acetylglucosamine-1-phosphate transferase
MHLENRKKIKSIGTIIFEITVVLCVVLFLLNHKIILLKKLLPDWNHAFDTIVIITFLYAVFLLWCDNFIKTHWKEKDYRPLIMIVLIFIYYVI